MLDFGDRFFKLYPREVKQLAEGHSLVKVGLEQETRVSDSFPGLVLH